MNNIVVSKLNSFTNIAFSCESSNKKSRKVMNLLKIKCNKPIFGVFTDIFRNFAAKIQILVRLLNSLEK